MCHKLGQALSVQEANRQEEIKAHNNPPSYYCYYWRTNTGNIRKTGYVGICACNTFQYWERTKKAAIAKLKG